jgi:3-hydroxyisobutyrate dehydrogenase-like beta-hydroxyacid dehydrogenase
VTFMSLPNDAIVEAVLFGGDGQSGLVDGACSGHLVFDLSTVSPESTRRNAARATEHGVRLIDAPVSGSVSGAVSATLAVMIGAPEADVAPYRSAVEAIGTSIFCLGAVGSGNILKLLNNLVALTSQAVLCEAIALADRVGVDRENSCRGDQQELGRKLHSRSQARGNRGARLRSGIPRRAGTQGPSAGAGADRASRRAPGSREAGRAAL